MPLNAVVPTMNFEDTVLEKANATSFTVDISNSYCQYQLDISRFGRGQDWSPAMDIGPGYWTFSPTDWQQFGVNTVGGIRFRKKLVDDIPVISVA